MVVGVLVAVAAGCRRTPPTPVAVASAASSVAPVDHLAPDELAPGSAEAFGLMLPKELHVEGRFPTAVYARGNVAPNAVAAYLRPRLAHAFAEVTPNGIVFARVKIQGAPLDRDYRVEVLAEGTGTRLVVRDITPRPDLAEHLTEEERWKRAGISRDGTVTDPQQLK